MINEVDCLLVGYRNGEIVTSLKDKIKIREGKDFNAAIGYLGTFLDKMGLSFHYINYVEDEYAKLVHLLNRNQYQLIAVSTTFCTSVETVRDITDLIRNIQPDVKIVMGGTFIARLIKDNISEDNQMLSYLFRQMRGDYYINSFQGEQSLVNIIKALKNNVDIEKVANIFYRKQKRFYGTEIITENNNLEENMVNWELFSNKRYKTIPVRTAISCPFHCAFCTHKADAGEYRYVSVDAIERELDTIARDDTVKTVHFIDDTFNVPQGRFKEILRLMVRKKYKFNWYSFLRCQFIDDETAALMKESKCSFVLLGIESGSQKMLDIMNKQVKVEKLKEGISILDKHGIKMHGMFLLGFPGETKETVEETLNFIEQTNLTTISVKPWFYEISTAITKRKEEFGIVGSHYNWKHKTMDYKTAESYVSQINQKYSEKDYDRVFISSKVSEVKIEDLA